MNISNRMGQTNNNIRRTYSVESSVHKLDLNIPQSINIAGQTYYNIRL